MSHLAMSLRTFALRIHDPAGHHVKNTAVIEHQPSYLDSLPVGDTGQTQELRAWLLVDRDRRGSGHDGKVRIGRQR